MSDTESTDAPTSMVQEVKRTSCIYGSRRTCRRAHSACTFFLDHHTHALHAQLSPQSIPYPLSSSLINTSLARPFIKMP